MYTPFSGGKAPKVAAQPEAKLDETMPPYYGKRKID